MRVRRGHDTSGVVFGAVGRYIYTYIHSSVRSRLPATPALTVGFRFVVGNRVGRGGGDDGPKPPPPCRAAAGQNSPIGPVVPSPKLNQPNASPATMPIASPPHELECTNVNRPRTSPPRASRPTRNSTCVVGTRSSCPSMGASGSSRDDALSSETESPSAKSAPSAYRSSTLIIVPVGPISTSVADVILTGLPPSSPPPPACCSPRRRRRRRRRPPPPTDSPSSSAVMPTASSPLATAHPASVIPALSPSVSTEQSADRSSVTAKERGEHAQMVAVPPTEDCARRAGLRATADAPAIDNAQAARRRMGEENLILWAGGGVVSASSVGGAGVHATLLYIYIYIYVGWYGLWTLYITVCRPLLR